MDVLEFNIRIFLKVFPDVTVDSSDELVPSRV